MNSGESAPSSAPGPDSKGPLVYEFSGWRLDPRRRLLTNPSGEAVSITAKAYEALLLLLQHSGELVTRADLIRSLWPRTIVDENNLNQAIASLRRVLGEGYILTIAGKGYQFVAPVTTTVMVEDLPQAAGKARRPNAAIAISATLAVLAIGCSCIWHAPFFVGAHSTPLGRVSRVAPLTTFRGDETTPSFAPDGTRVAFAWARDAGESDIYVMQIGSG